MAIGIERYGKLFELVHDSKDEWGDMLAGAADKSSERYGNLFRKFSKPQKQSYEELSAQMKRGADTHISIEDCIAYLDAAKAKINKLEAVGTYQATQESKNIKSDFAELVEEMLKDKYFVICDIKGKFSAFIFDTPKKRDSVASTNPQQILLRTDYNEFKEQAKIGYRNICNFFSCDDECLVFQI